MHEARGDESKLAGPGGTIAPGAAFVGREHELSEIERGLDEAAVGRGNLFLVSGDAGIGKTRLADEVASRSSMRGFRVFWGRAWEGEGTPAFWPWVQVLRSCVRGTTAADLGRHSPATLAHVAELVPELREKLPDLPTPTTSPDSEQARFDRFDAVATFLGDLSRAHPLLIILDDIHWADRPSLGLLELFAQDFSGVRILALGTLRQPRAGETELDRDLEARLIRLGRHLSLPGLSTSDLARLVQESGGSKPLDSFVAALQGATNGNPFFAVEVLRFLATEPPEAQLEQALSESFPIPESVRAVIRKRLSLLPRETLWVLTTAAVAGRELDVAILERACERDAAAILEALAPALEGGLLIHRREEVMAKYFFSHGLVRETLYEDLSPAERAHLHRRVGDASESLHAGHLGDHLAALAHHFGEAIPAGSGVDKAIDFSKRAGERARSLLAYEEAARHFGRALELVERHCSGDVRVRCERLTALAEALWLHPSATEQGSWKGALPRDLCIEAVALAEKCGDAELLARAALGVGSPYSSTTPPGMVDHELIRVLESALRALPERGSLVRARVMARLALALRYAGGEDRPLELARDAVAMTRRHKDPAARLDVLGRAFVATWGPDELEDRIARNDEVIDLAEKIEDWRFVIQGRMWRTACLLEAGRADLARREVRRIEAELERTHAPYRLFLPAVLAGTLALLEGRLDDAQSCIEEYPTWDHPILQAWKVIERFVLGWERGGLDEHVAAVEAAAIRYPAIALWGALLALTHAAIGREAEARQALDDLAANRFGNVIRDQTWHLTMWCLSETATLLGDRPRAEALYERLEPFADRCFVDYVIWCGGSVARSLGDLATLLERFDDARRHYEHALEVNTRMGARPAVARTRYGQAAMLVARGSEGDHEKALPFLEETLAAARELGMGGLEKRALGLRERLGAGISATPKAGIRRTGGGWTISWEGESFVLPHSKGLGYLAHLLARPGTEIRAVDLVAAVEGVSPEGGGERADLGHAGELLDERARSEYRQHLADLEGELEEATSSADVGRAERLRVEIEFVTRELTAAYGLGGRVRRGADVAERVRKAVTNRIRSAIGRIEQHDAKLAAHLTASVRTGKLCAYEPSAEPLRWSS